MGDLLYHINNKWSGWINLTVPFGAGGVVAHPIKPRNINSKECDKWMIARGKYAIRDPQYLP